MGIGEIYVDVYPETFIHELQECRRHWIRTVTLDPELIVLDPPAERVEVTPEQPEPAELDVPAPKVRRVMKPLLALPAVTSKGQGAPAIRNPPVKRNFSQMEQKVTNPDIVRFIVDLSAPISNHTILSDKLFCNLRMLSEHKLLIAIKQREQNPLSEK